MKKFLLSIIAAGVFTSYATADEPNTMVIHFNDGTSQSISIDAIDYMDFITVPGVLPGDKDYVNIYLSDRSFNYSQLTSSSTFIGQLLWQDVNNKIYGSQGLTAETFWDFYKHNYNVTLDVATNDTGSTLRLFSQEGTVNVPFKYAQDGIYCNVDLWDTATTTSQIDFAVSNLCKTDITYHNFQGKGAKFIVTITLTPDNINANQTINIIQEFYVLNDFNPYQFNENFIVPGSSPSIVQTKGVVTSNGWAMQMDIAQAFKKMNGKDIFQYFADPSVDKSYANILSVPAINFGFYGTPTQGVAYGNPPFANHIVGLTQPLATASKQAPMQYEVTLVNQEILTRNFIVEFINPFVEGNPNPLTIRGNYLGTQTADAAKAVIVNERNSNPTEAIYSYVGGALALSPRATDFFKINPNQVTVSYAWNTQKGDWQAFAEQLPEGSSLTLNGSTIEYVASAVLQLDRTLYINATVTFEDLSVVVVEIPVKFLKEV